MRDHSRIRVRVRFLLYAQSQHECAAVCLFVENYSFSSQEPRMSSRPTVSRTLRGRWWEEPFAGIDNKPLPRFPLELMMRSVLVLVLELLASRSSCF